MTRGDGPGRRPDPRGVDPRAAPIGVFDSGVGGLTVVEALARRLPGESILYLGDTARLPYGTKSAATVTQYTRNNLAFLLGRGVKAVVIACNTASALALPALGNGNDATEVPLWGVIEPGAAHAAEVARHHVGVIGTESTIRSGAYARALEARRPDLAVTSVACPLFVPLVEEGWEEDPVAEVVARRYLLPLIDVGIDTLVLGCTHYPLLRPMLERLFGDTVRLVDSATAVAETVALDLTARGLTAAAGTAAGGRAPEHHFCVTDDSDRFSRIARRILDLPSLSLELVEVR